MDISTKTTLRAIGILLVFGILIFIAKNCFVEKWNEASQFASDLAIILTLIITAAMYTDTAEKKIKESKEQREFDVNDKTMAMLERFSSDSMLKARQFSKQIQMDKPKKSEKELIKLIKSDVALRQSITELFNFFSKLELAIELGQINKEVIIKSLGTTIVSIIDRLDFWNKKIDKENKNTSHTDDIANMRRLFNNEI